MINLTLEQAAHSHYNNGSQAEIGSGARATYETKKESFIAGAVWQNEQYVELVITIESFLKHIKCEQWSIDHSKETIQKALDQITNKP